MKVYIIAGFPGVGKSTAGITLMDEVYDLESSNYHWEKTPRLNDDGTICRNPNPEWPNNYIDRILALQDLWENIDTNLRHQGTNRYICISTHKEVLDELDNRGIRYIIVVPINMNQYYIDHRFVPRGSPPQFCENIIKNFDSYINDIESHSNVSRIYSNITLQNLITNLYQNTEVNVIEAMYDKSEAITVYIEDVEEPSTTIVFYNKSQEKSIDRIIKNDDRCIKLDMPGVNDPNDKFEINAKAIDATGYNGSCPLILDILGKACEVYDDGNVNFIFVKDYYDDYMRKLAMKRNFCFVHVAEDTSESEMDLNKLMASTGGCIFEKLYGDHIKFKLIDLVSDDNYRMYIKYANNFYDFMEW